MLNLTMNTNFKDKNAFRGSSKTMFSGRLVRAGHPWGHLCF